MERLLELSRCSLEEGTYLSFEPEHEYCDEPVDEEVCEMVDLGDTGKFSRDAGLENWMMKKLTKCSRENDRYHFKCYSSDSHQLVYLERYDTNHNEETFMDYLAGICTLDGNKHIFTSVLGGHPSVFTHIFRYENSDGSSYGSKMKKISAKRVIAKIYDDMQGFTSDEDH